MKLIIIFHLLPTFAYSYSQDHKRLLEQNQESLVALSRKKLSMSDSRPSLFEDMISMLSVSNLIYELAFLDRWANFPQGSVKNPDFLENLPKTAPEVWNWFQENMKLLKQYEVATRRKYDIEFDLNTLEKILSAGKSNTSRDSSPGCCGENKTLEVFEDDSAFHGMESEIVYDITKNPHQKRITVVFRGSQNKKDWFTNFKVTTVAMNATLLEQAIPSPNDLFLDAFQNVDVHSGLFNYLFQPTRSNLHNDVKFLQIMKDATRLLECNPDFSLWFTGHSLGAALATLAATAAAISDEIPNPVRLITFGSPQVGKDEFVRAFQKLEQAGRIEHVRVTTNDDLVPQLFGLIGYRHTGVHLNLRRNIWRRTDTVSISRSRTSGFFCWTNEMRMPLSQVKGPQSHHRLEEHDRRLHACKPTLESLTIDELYECAQWAW
eukprot:CAMPEP_0195281226 /NCGR_PEP_ID=MMETSP0707-20130614/629_1 /TAXON_ID=33640 /ORGANISM="Asterionellopsis glacialis, Strain CCMP134" /LENGTH=433 /DNA_ID=CAMNT_0040340095 /DNA_START=31 /DNA_END=1332 /DNA_ORIENTATION=-